MPSLRRSTRLAAVLALLLLAIPAAALLAPGTRAADTGSLRSQVQRDRSREQGLSSAVAHLGRLERAASRDVALLQGRLDAAQADLGAWQGRLAATQSRLRAARRHLGRLRLRLAADRRTLAAMLQGSYMADKPDLVGVVLEAHGFADLLERLSFARRVQDANAVVLGAVRRARDATVREQHDLAVLVPRQRAATEAVQRERDALAAIGAGLRRRQAALAAARGARLAALHATRAGRRRAQRTLARREAEQAAAAQQTAGPGGPWAIPWPVVQCESGGQDLPPNGAGASGYYQILDTTWRGLGGSTPHAYQAPKAEQDRLAAALWDGGRGAHNWVCAALVGAG
jgi:peptidoglycan hydrolase CwlO-like protein